MKLHGGGNLGACACSVLEEGSLADDDNHCHEIEPLLIKISRYCGGGYDETCACASGLVSVHVCTNSNARG